MISVKKLLTNIFICIIMSIQDMSSNDISSVNIIIFEAAATHTVAEGESIWMRD